MSADDFVSKMYEQEKREKKFRQTLVGGETVAIRSHHWGVQYSLSKVERVTKTQIVLSSTAKYRIDDGRRVGDGPYGGSVLVPVDDEVRDWLKRESIKRKLSALIESITVAKKHLTLAEMEELTELLDKFEAKRKAAHAAPELSNAKE